ncbi:monovalent cation:proton antiporter-2 (CPA2) family protein [Nevskia ramosa]|uniref:monovalent cation:proton antiporter-2 (CPA2) family protein n=1 Tax=Nevskia ramosa TaxID=64002 RepID=UPI0003B368DD|nr:monovalent cation:proton antiporter-2 (CPA2) family protein [Nevskia ramosa]
MLKEIALFLAAAVIAVPLFKRLGLGAVLGYLFAGLLIGPSGLGMIEGVERVLHVSEFGVVLLMFVIGLELQISRLWRLRAHVFGLGGAQVLLTAAALTGCAIALGLPSDAAIVAGFALAMSSTAFVLQMLAERKELADHHGRAAFSILLFQDIAVIPFLALLPLLGTPIAGHSSGGWLGGAKALAVVVLVVVGGRYLLRPIFRRLAAVEMPEVFTAAALLIVTGTALAMEAVGLSMSLGAFLAGVLLADSEYRHELQADIEPFKGLLLGLFFIAVGMSAQLSLVMLAPLVVLGLTFGLIAVKSSILYFIGRVSGLANDSALKLAFALPQGGEFAFVLFGVAATAGILQDGMKDLLIVVVTASMIATPPLYALIARWSQGKAEPPAYDPIDAPEHDILIAGFGPFGQIVGRMLRVKRIPYTVLERDARQVDFVRQFGNTIFYSDAGRVEVLRAAKADKARYFVLAIADVEQSLRIAEVVRRHFPNLRIFACARDRPHAMRLMDLGITDIIRRSYASSLEAAGSLLQALGEPEQQIKRELERFRHFDQETLLKQHAIYRDEQALVQTAKEFSKELEQLFEADALAAEKAAS